MRRLPFYVALFSVLATGYAGAAEDEPFSFRGIKLGITIDEFRRIPHPEMPNDKKAHVRCSTDIKKNEYDLFHLDSDLKKAGVHQCGFFSSRSSSYHDRISVANIQYVAEPSFHFFAKNNEPHRLFRIIIPVAVPYTNQLLDALRERYGEPQTSTDREVQNAFGASFQSRFRMWQNSVSEISVLERAPKLDGTTLMYLHTSLMKELERRLEEINGRPSSKL